MSNNKHKKIRKEAKELLKLLPPSIQQYFKRLYSHNDLDKSIDDIIDNMPYKEIKWAYEQIINTHIKFL